jgi:hypothetical protein
MNLENTKQRKTDRVLVLRPMEGKDPKDSSGKIDKRLFSGENNLHIVMNPATLLWGFKYDSGGLQETLKQSFTSYDKAFEHAKGYFERRNVQIVEVLQ